MYSILFETYWNFSPNLLAKLSRSPIPGSAGSASPCSESNAALPSRAVAGLGHDGLQDQSLLLHILTVCICLLYIVMHSMEHEKY